MSIVGAKWRPSLLSRNWENQWGLCCWPSQGQHPVEIAVYRPPQGTGRFEDEHPEEHSYLRDLAAQPRGGARRGPPGPTQATSPRRRGGAQGSPRGQQRESEVGTCLLGHKLNGINTKMDGYTCDVCLKEFKRGATLYHCEPCAYDKCEDCHASDLRTNRQQEASYEVSDLRENPTKPKATNSTAAQATPPGTPPGTPPVSPPATPHGHGGRRDRNITFAAGAETYQVAPQLQSHVDYGSDDGYRGLTRDQLLAKFGLDGPSLERFVLLSQAAQRGPPDHLRAAQTADAAGRPRFEVITST